MKTSSYLGILISLSILLFPASSIKAEDGDLALLSKSETWQILNGVQKEFISNKNPLEFINLNGEQQAAISTLRSLVREEFLNFLPAFISTETVKVFLQVGKQLVASPTSLGELLEKVESFTVKEAVKIGMGWFVQNEIKISSGILEGKQLGITFQYILTYQEIDNDHANVAMQFYSPDSFKPPRPTASLTMGVPYFADELPKDGKIRPFVVHAQTKIEKIGLGWVVDSSADTKITVEFPEKVPRLQLAKEWPYPLEEQKINFLNAWTTAKRVLEYLKSVGSEAVGKAADFVHKVQELAKDVIDYTSQFIGRGGAGLVDPFSKESQQLDHIESQLTLAVEALEAKEDQVKLRVKLSPTKDEVKNEVQPVENLVGLSFPQEEILQQLQPDPAPKRSLELNEIKDEVKEGPIPQEVVPELNQKLSQAKDNEQILRLAKDEVELSPTKFCTVDPSRGPALSTVMFSEIAWMGSINSANDEWIKLKNISNAEVKLEGWQVQDADNQIQIALGKDHRVFSQDSFILERTNDDSLPGIQAHVIYTGALNNTNEAVYLFDEKCVLRDKVVASPNWLAGDNVSRKPMARNNDLGWYTQGSGSSASIALTNGSPNAGSTPTAGGLPPKTYPKILISEVQTAGVSSQTEEFVELYNPTNAPVDLTDWYVQKKTQGADSFSTFASKNILSGKTIQASGYFLIAREGSSFAPSADAVTSYSLGDNNTLALKNPNGEIVDKVAWGDVQDAESTSAPNPLAGQSLNRIWDTANQTYYDRDNNSIDFALHNPVSPKAVNPTPTPPSDPWTPDPCAPLPASRSGAAPNSQSAPRPPAPRPTSPRQKRSCAG